MTSEIRHNCKTGYACSGFCCTKIEDFGVSFGNIKILEQVNVHIHCGELTAIIGPNGAGKTTLLKAILGEIRHTGALKYVNAQGVDNGYPLIGYVPQHLDFDAGSPTSVFDIFMACSTQLPCWLFKPNRIRTRVAASLAKVKAEHLLDRRLGTLSGGELQRVLLALALDPIPNLLLLDEPVAGIDHNGLELFYNTVSDLRNNYDLSIILVSHDLDLVARYSDRVVLINKTVVCSGSPQEVFSDERTARIFGMSWYKLGREIRLPDAKPKGDI
ncbi:MAG: metal ABC transporter ATP-binding protein [Syntrophomonadaceae bacterium]|nr:metal ABC transporter ATP-binding protein [Syntrophomonadaceae bacterium]